VCCTWLHDILEGHHLWWNMKASKCDLFWMHVFSMVITIVLSPILFIGLWLPMLPINLNNDSQIPSRWLGGTFAHWHQKLHTWKVFHAQTLTTKQFAMVFVCQFLKDKSFILSSSYKKKTFSKCSKAHICTFIWSLMWCFQHPFLILLSYYQMVYWIKKIISRSFFSKKTCMVPYFLMFFIYLLNSKAIVQPLLNPRLQFYWNAIYILGFPWLRFKVKCSMDWTAIFFMGVLLMIPNNFHNIWILAQALHRKLGHAPLFFWFGLLQIITTFSAKLQWYLDVYKT